MEPGSFFSTFKNLSIAISAEKCKEIVNIPKDAKMETKTFAGTIPMISAGNAVQFNLRKAIKLNIAAA